MIGAYARQVQGPAQTYESFIRHWKMKTAIKPSETVALLQIVLKGLYLQLFVIIV